MADSGVARRFKMLTYWRVRSAFKTSGALLSTIKWPLTANFEDFS